MCFSATASIAASAVLLPLGAYSLQQSRQLQKPYWVFAVYPLAFGLQQAAEGWLWLLLDDPIQPSTRLPALIFMFFSHLFWLFWVPFSAAMVEDKRFRRRLFYAIAILGGLYGLSMYIPAVLYSDWLTLRLHQHSIVYDLRLFYDKEVPRIVIRAIYALLVLVPLLATSHKEVRYFGLLILASVIFATAYFAETFISVWCYFAAIISTYIFYMLRRIHKY
jgi:hypothetical protein